MERAVILKVEPGEMAVVLNVPCEHYGATAACLWTDEEILRYVGEWVEQCNSSAEDLRDQIEQQINQ